MFIQRSSISVRDCVFQNNTAPYGGAVYINSPTGFPAFAKCRFFGNTAGSADEPTSGIGGAILARDGFAQVVVSDCLFANNSANVGGALCAAYDIGFVLSGCTFVHNTAYVLGAAIFLDLGISEINGCIVAYNTGYLALESTSHPLNISCTNIFGNDGGNWVEGLEPLEAVNGNMSLDPMFCDFDHRQYNISWESPCAPGNNSCGALIGSEYPWCGLTCGDMDGDGSATPADLEILLNAYYSQTIAETLSPGAVDMDCDGWITLADLVLLSGYVYGYGPAPCCVEPPPPPPPAHDPIDHSANLGR